MPAPIPDTVKALVKRDYFSGLSLHDAAKAHGVSPRKAQSWSKDENWAKLKAAAQSAPSTAIAPNVVSFDRPRSSITPAVIPAEVSEAELEAVKDLREVLDRAIARLDRAIKQPYDMRSLGQLVTALARATETRRKIASDEELVEELLRRFPNPRALVAHLKGIGYAAPTPLTPR